MMDGSAFAGALNTRRVFGIALLSYINLASADKKARAAQINSDIGSGASMLLYTGSPPASPDYPATGSLLVTLPLSTPAAVASYAVQSAGIAAPGSGGANGAQLVTGTTGTGTKFQASVTITGGAITAVIGIVVPGVYSVSPISLVNEPVTGAGLTGAALSVVLTAQLVFGAITQANAVSTGTAGYARIVTSGGTGIVDLDCGTSNASVIMNTTSIALNGPILCSADLLTEQ
jgi:hypothetical protein